MTLADDQLLFECGLAPAPKVAMSWRLIEMKLMYYRSDLVHPSWGGVSDAEYDALESQCEEYTTDMVGIDLNRPSVQVVLNKLSKPKTHFE